MTRRVMTALGMAAHSQKAAWDEASWGGTVVRGPELERLLLELRVRADAYSALAEMTFGDLASWLGIEEEQQDAE